MKTIQVFDPALCCSTGVCGVDVDQALVNFSADVDWAKQKAEDKPVKRMRRTSETSAGNSDPRPSRTFETLQNRRDTEKTRSRNPSFFVPEAPAISVVPWPTGSPRAASFGTASFPRLPCRDPGRYSTRGLCRTCGSRLPANRRSGAGFPASSY